MNRDTYRYAPYYCEENIWHLCQEEDFRRFDRKVVVISNERRSCALWNQRARVAQGEPVFWDYHVIMLFMNDGWQVYDLDTMLVAPTPIAQYVQCTFGQTSAPEEFPPLFRIFDADEFVTVFSSDRSHMLTADGDWLVAPPPWPAIVRNQRSNLMQLIDMQNPSFGTAMNLTQLKAHFAINDF
jgi:hypothetical protein